MSLGFGVGACDKKAETAPATDDKAAEATAKTADEPKAGEGDPAVKTDPTADEIKNAAIEAAKSIEGVEALGAKVDGAAAILDGKDKKPLDAATYEKLIVDHAACEVKPTGDIDYQCPAVKALQEATSGGQALKDLAGGQAALGQKLIGHESPAVRIKAAGLMGSMMGTKAESQDAIVDAAMKETHPGVLKALLRTVSNDGAKNPKVAGLLLWAADHSDTLVRTNAIYALSSTWNREMAGGPEKLITLMESDADAKVRATACEYAGKLGDAKFMPSYEKLTADASDVDLLAACTKGLIQMWWSYPFHENANEDAFNLTLKLLGDKPRTDKNPNWTIPGLFRSKAADAFANWRAKNPWYDESKLQAVLVDIIKDPHMNWLGRVGAVDSLGANGTKADLEALLIDFPADSKGDAGHVHKKLTEVIAKAK